MRNRAVFLVTLALAGAGCAAGGSSTWTPPRVGRRPGPAVRAAAGAAGAARPRLDENARLGDYLAHAALNNPGLRSAFYSWQAATERPAQARSLPDPRLNFGYFIREVETRVGPQEAKIGLSQTIPWPGKLIQAGAVAEGGARTARARYEAAKLRTFYRVKDAYYEYWYLARAIEVMQANVELVTGMEEVARTRYKAAAAGHPDVIRAQVELARLQDRLKALGDLRAPLTARLNAILDRPPETPLAWPNSPPPSLALAATDAQILAQARSASPDLAALEAEIAQAQSAVRLARQSYFPDFRIGVDYILTDEPDGPMPAEDRGEDPVLLGVGINLPIWFGRNGASVREARSRLEAARLTRRDRENKLLARVKRTLYEVRDAERKVELYGGTLLPKAEQALGAAEAAFRAGRAGFTDLVDAQRVLLEFRLTHERARTSHAQRLAEIEMLVGQPLPLRAPGDGAQKEAGKDLPGPEEGGEP